MTSNLNHILTDDFMKSRQIVDWGYTDQLHASTFSHFEEWVNQGLHANLSYLSDERKEKRRYLKNVYPAAQSALTFLFSYAEIKKKFQLDKQLLAGYVLGFEGHDYHYLVKQYLEDIFLKLKSENQSLEHVMALDVQSVLDRDLAYRCGLGFFGKNSMLISKQFGSYTIIGTLILNQKLNLKIRETDTNHCGNCTQCIEACPTQAIIRDGVIDAKKCISYFTIEEFKPVDPPKGYASQNEIFGCDICQDVCPWNKKVLKTITPKKFNQRLEILYQYWYQTPFIELVRKLEQLSNREYRRLFKQTPLERTGRIGMLKNLTNKIK